MDNLTLQQTAQKLADEHTKLELAKKVIELAMSVHGWEKDNPFSEEDVEFNNEDYV